MRGDVKMIPGTEGSLACLPVRRSLRMRNRRDEAPTASTVAKECD